MARLDLSGIDEAVEELARMGQLAGPVADDMLRAGSVPMVDAWKDAITRFGHVKTGTMRDSVKPTKIKTRQGERTIDVYPQGYDRTDRKKPTRNAEKAFVLHYGRRNMDASHFVDKAVADGGPLAQDAMEKRWNEFIEKGR